MRRRWTQADRDRVLCSDLPPAALAAEMDRSVKSIQRILYDAKCRPRRRRGWAETAEQCSRLADHHGGQCRLKTMRLVEQFGRDYHDCGRHKKWSTFD